MSGLDPIALTQALIRCPSVTPRDEGALAVVEKALAPLGFACERMPFGSGAERVENLFARIGKKGPHFCFAGHTDVVPIGNKADWSIEPFGGIVKDGVLYGRGAEDMKGAIACFIAASAKFIEEKGKDFGGSISLMLTGDEEGAAVYGTREMLPVLKQSGDIPDVCLVGEPTNPETIGEMVKIGRRGSMNCVLTVEGRQGHVAYPQRADNPVTRLVNILHALKTHTLDKGTKFFDPSNLEVVSVDVGNAATNVIPARATARFNIRFNDTHTSRAIEEWIHKVCREQGARYTLDVKVTGEAFLTQPGPLSDLVSKVVQDITGRTPQLSTTGGTSDARFIREYCPVIEFGATGRTSHMVDEHVATADLNTLAEIYYRVLCRFFQIA